MVLSHGTRVRIPVGAILYIGYHCYCFDGMKRKIKTLSQKFFNRQTLKVAEGLIGKFLVRKIGGRQIESMIIEVEAYRGLDDKASHASRGKTPRTNVMFGSPGYWYVYLVYGMYHCLNVVTEKKNYPAAVLIRGVYVDGCRIQGPGRVCRYLHIDRRFNNLRATRKNNLWVEDRGIKIKPREVQRGKRIGVDYAGAWKEKLWRFYIKSVESVS